MNFDSLNEALNALPILTAILASIGLATVAFLGWTAIKPMLSYLVSGTRQLMTFWLYSLIIAGGGFCGYAYLEFKGMWFGLGVTTFSLGVVTAIAYWIRQWVKWVYKEEQS